MNESITDEYNITLKVRNNLLLQAFKRKGETPGRVLAQKIGISYNILNDYITLKRSPLDSEGDYRDEMYKICEFLNMSPSSLWTDEQLTPLDKSTVEVTASYEQLTAYLPRAGDGIASLENEETKRLVDEMLDTLDDRCKHLIKRRFGIEGDPATLNQIAEEFNICPQRVRAIEYKALHILRHPTRSAKMQEHLGLRPPKPYEFL